MQNQRLDSTYAEESAATSSCLDEFDGTIEERARKCLLLDPELKTEVCGHLLRHMRAEIAKQDLIGPLELPHSFFVTLSTTIDNGAMENAAGPIQWRNTTTTMGVWMGLAVRYPNFYDRVEAEQATIAAFKPIRSYDLTDHYMSAWEAAPHQLPPAFETFTQYPDLMTSIIDRRDRATGVPEDHNRMSELVQFARLCRDTHARQVMRSSNPLPN